MENFLCVGLSFFFFSKTDVCHLQCLHSLGACKTDKCTPSNIIMCNEKHFLRSEMVSPEFTVLNVIIGIMRKYALPMPNMSRGNQENSVYMSFTKPVTSATWKRKKAIKKFKSVSSHITCTYWRCCLTLT